MDKSFVKETGMGALHSGSEVAWFFLSEVTLKLLKMQGVVIAFVNYMMNTSYACAHVKVLWFAALTVGS